MTVGDRVRVTTGLHQASTNKLLVPEGTHGMVTEKRDTGLRVEFALPGNMGFVLDPRCLELVEVPR